MTADASTGEAGTRAAVGTGAALDMLRTQFDYSMWARDQLLPLLEGLETEAIKAADQKGVYGSIHDTLAHMASSEWLWLQRCLGDSPLRTPTGEDFATLTLLVSWWNDVHSQVMLFLNNTSEADLGDELTYLAADGKRRTRKVWHMLMQVPNHQTEHRSQIATMLGSMGLEVPQTDLVVYLSKQS
jgi:uncharacterized damage-inducible protein DinB